MSYLSSTLYSLNKVFICNHGYLVVNITKTNSLEIQSNNHT